MVYVYIGLGAVVLLCLASIRRVVIFEYQRGVVYTRGRFSVVRGPGTHWYVPFFTKIRIVDTRPRFVSIGGQEILSSDGITLKVSLAAEYGIADAALALNSVMDCHESLYVELQLILREIVGGTGIEDLLKTRSDLAGTLMEKAAPKAEAMGLKLTSANIKDIMFPGALKDIFAQVVKARQEGLANLEKARGETAALRNLANAAKMMETNPGLMQLRLLQAFGESSGNTMVLGTPLENISLQQAAKKPDTT
jgi:regulator of protease activity HflC (stomatin/prohibitin superfamily)